MDLNGVRRQIFDWVMRRSSYRVQRRLVSLVVVIGRWSVVRTRLKSAGVDEEQKEEG